MKTQMAQGDNKLVFLSLPRGKATIKLLEPIGQMSSDKTFILLFLL